MTPFPATCDACGKDEGCTCPPCGCVWCRQRRGEQLTGLDAAKVRQHERGIRSDEIAESAERMRAKMKAALERDRE